ncbi:MAG: hypothetical protein Kow00117_11720 [Phototrophicales bacterium]
MKRLLLVLSILLSLGSVVQPLQAQNAVWRLEVFDNPYFIGNPVIDRNESRVAFYWGAGSPGTGIPNDNFTARISTDVFLPAGTYRFYLLADDGANVVLDFNRSIVNTYNNPRPGEIISSDLTLGAGTYHIQIDYIEYDLNAYIYFGWESTADGIQGPNFPAIPTSDALNPGETTQEITNITWTGQYYNNRNLTGFPSAIVGEIGLSKDWGAGAPYPTMNSDNFSARWSTTQYLDGSEYLIQVQADDGVRVWLDGILVIDQWNLATGQTYNYRIQPIAGNHSLRVEFYEAEGLAFINFKLAKIVLNGQVSPTNSWATVTAYRLNVRDLPNATTGNVLTRISRNETYPVLGRTADNRWVQISVDGLTGWVSTGWVNVTNIYSVPVTYNTTVSPTATPAPAIYTARTRTEVNLRTGPGTNYDRVLIIPQFATVDIIGRNLRATWWQVRYDGTVGWASAEYAIIQDGADLNRIPVTWNN